jgi:diguanylate cyclase (GGDEF)-like protein
LARNVGTRRRDPPRAIASVDLDADSIAANAALVDAARRRLRRNENLHRRSTLVMGSALLLVVAGWLAISPRAVDPATFAACVAAFVFAGSVEFEIGPGCALPTAPVQVVALFLLPPQYVPLAVLLGLVGSAVVARVRDRQRNEHLLVLAGSAWHGVGPAAVFAIAHVSGPRLSDWPVYAVALAAQFVLDAAASWIHTCCGLGVSMGKLAAALRFTFLCDLCLAPIGYAAILARPASPAALAFLVPPTLLFAVLQADRRRQLDEKIALGAAFTSTSDLARRDPLTGLANRLAWEETIALVQAEDASIGVVLADVDGLKAANDTFGHDAGDRLLVAVAEIVHRSLPTSDGTRAFRIGGDEFAILLPGASQRVTDDLAQSLRDLFLHAPPLAAGICVSASIGSARAPTGPNIGRAIAAADRGVNLEKISRGVRRHS